MNNNKPQTVLMSSMSKPCFEWFFSFLCQCDCPENSTCQKHVSFCMTWSMYLNSVGIKCAVASCLRELASTTRADFRKSWLGRGHRQFQEAAWPHLRSVRWTGISVWGICLF